MPSVAGLYGGDMPEKPAKKYGPRSRGASARNTGKNARKTKSPAKAELDAFDDIDYDVLGAAFVRSRTLSILSPA